VGFELTTLVVIGTDCIGSYKSNYHTITTTMAPNADWKVYNIETFVLMTIFSCFPVFLILVRIKLHLM